MLKRQTLRLIGFGALAVGAIVGGILFYMKYTVGEMRTHLGQVNKNILDTTDAIHVLDAEWGYLNQPDRLKKLNETHGNLVPLDVMQLASVDSFFDRHRLVTSRMLASVRVGEDGKNKRIS